MIINKVYLFPTYIQVNLTSFSLFCHLREMVKQRLQNLKHQNKNCKEKNETRIIINLGDEEEGACKVKVCTYQKGD